jgi:uncharacterized protein (DUF427 family)
MRWAGTGLTGAMRATLNGTVIAESDATIVIEGNHYFPPESIKREHFAESAHHTSCSWKGTASYYDVTVDGETKPNVAWFYADPKDAAAEIKDYVAFYRAVNVA